MIVGRVALSLVRSFAGGIVAEITRPVSVVSHCATLFILFVVEGVDASSPLLDQEENTPKVLIPFVLFPIVQPIQCKPFELRVLTVMRYILQALLRLSNDR